MNERFILPKTVQATNWVRSTDSLRNHLKQRLATVQARAAAKRKEADEIELEGRALVQAIGLLDQLLPPPRNALSEAKVVQLSEPGQLTRQESAGSVKSGQRFSLLLDACKNCGRGPSEGIKHAARGLCHACYWIETHPNTGNGAVESVTV